MFMCCIGIFDSILGRKEAKYVIWELIYELRICYGLHGDHAKSYELTSICCVQ